MLSEMFKGHTDKLEPAMACTEPYLDDSLAGNLQIQADGPNRSIVKSPVTLAVSARMIDMS
jgi:hypothetical protein